MYSVSLGGPGHKKFSKTKSEESGYDSDTTRKSGSSPRGSVKSDSFETESASSTDLSNTGISCLGECHGYSLLKRMIKIGSSMLCFCHKIDGWRIKVG